MLEVDAFSCCGTIALWLIKHRQGSGVFAGVGNQKLGLAWSGLLVGAAVEQMCCGNAGTCAFWSARISRLVGRQAGGSVMSTSSHIDTFICQNVYLSGFVVQNPHSCVHTSFSPHLYTCRPPFSHAATTAIGEAKRLLPSIANRRRCRHCLAHYFSQPSSAALLLP